MSGLHGHWKQVLDSSEIRRSSQVAAVLNQTLAVFGGEIKPRQPVDSKLYRISLGGVEKQNAPDVFESPSAPSLRVGSACTTLKGNMYLFSGRGGEAMAPIEEGGALHVFNIQSQSWSTIKPSDAEGPIPKARSYHAMASNGIDTIFLHAGCPERGRLSDLWSFNIDSRRWKKHVDAPGPARGGTSIAWLNGKLYRMNGFDGKTEQGLALEIYTIEDDRWSSKTWDLQSGPSPRSVSTLLPLHVDGRAFLVTMFGECDPSSLGHQGAGRFLDDVWAFDDATETWHQVQVGSDTPKPRGWFAADCLSDNKSLVVHGGLAEDNSRLGDVWVLAF